MDLGQRVMEYAMTGFPDFRIHLCSMDLYRDRTKPKYSELLEYEGWLREYEEKIQTALLLIHQITNRFKGRTCPLLIQFIKNGYIM